MHSIKRVRYYREPCNQVAVPKRKLEAKNTLLIYYVILNEVKVRIPLSYYHPVFYKRVIKKD